MDTVIVFQRRAKVNAQLRPSLRENNTKENRGLRRRARGISPKTRARKSSVLNISPYFSYYGIELPRRK